MIRWLRGGINAGGRLGGDQDVGGANRQDRERALLRFVAKVKQHPDELFLSVDVIVTNLSWPRKRVAAFYDHLGTANRQKTSCPKSCRSNIHVEG